MIRALAYKLIWYTVVFIPIVTGVILLEAVDRSSSDYRTACSFVAATLCLILLALVPWGERLLGPSIASSLGLKWDPPLPSRMQFVLRNLGCCSTIGAYTLLDAIARYQFLKTHGLKNGYAISHMEDIIGTGGWVPSYPCLDEGLSHLVEQWCSDDTCHCLLYDWLLVGCAAWALLDFVITVLSPRFRRGRVFGLNELISGTSWSIHPNPHMS